MNHLILANAFETVWKFFWDGGIFMLFLLGTSIFSFTLIVWRIVALRRELVIPKAVEEAIARFSPTEANLANLLDLVHKNDSPFSRIVLQACKQFSWSKNENLTALQTHARREIHQLEGGLTLLEVITGLGPLLGLLGTISGLTQVFGSLGASAGAPDTTGVAAGIAEAMNATIMGLVVAIPSLIAFSVFAKRVEWLALDMEAGVEALLAKCYHESHAGDTSNAEEMNHLAEVVEAEEAKAAAAEAKEDASSERSNANRSSTPAKKPAGATS